MIRMGALYAIAGLVGIFEEQVYYVGANSHLVVSVDHTTWGWVHLIFGLIGLFAGFAVMAGATWARVVGIILAGISVILNFAYMAAFPVGSVVIIALDALVIYAVAVHGGELRN